MAQTEAERVADRQADARRNTELGWCPCGEEEAYECECGISRLSYLQGLAVPVTRLSPPPMYRQPESMREVDGQ